MVMCAAPGCMHSSKNCTLFRFPSDAVRRKFWMKNCGRSFATTTHRLCKHHFNKHFIQEKGTRKILAKNAIPTIFQNINSPKRNRNHQLKKMRNEKVNHEENSAKALNSVFHLKIKDCWSEKQKHEVKRKLPDTMYEDSNPLDDDVLVESNKGKTNNNQSLGLENIPIVGSDISSESNIEFSYSTPRNLNDLSPFLAKWPPKINNVVSIIEDLIDSSDNDNDISDEETDSNHVVYIDEDLVKQEEFVDENSEESFDCESNKSSRKDKEELNSSFDEEKVKKEFHITDTLRIKLPKLNMTGKSINVRDSNFISLHKTRGIMSKEKITSSSNKQKKLLNKSIFSRKSSRNHKTSQSNQRRRSSQSSTKRSSPESKSQNKTRNRSSNNRQSLRLSGKSPEIKLPDYVPLITRSGKKRIYEEPKNRSTNPRIYTIDDKEVPSRASKSPVLDESKSEDMLRSRSPSPSAYRKNVEVFFVCQCCDEKYDSVERVKVHVRTHFPNCTTN